MKVIIVGTAYPYRGGLSAYNERIAREYQQQGHDVEIYTFTLQYPSFLFPGKTQYSSDAAPTDLKIKRRVNSVNPFNWLSVGKEISKKRPDLVLIKFWLPFMAPCLGTIARVIGRNKKTKVISILDNIIPHEKRLADKIFASYFTGSVDGFVAMSRSVLADVEIFDKKKPKVFCPHPLYDNFGEKPEREKALQQLGLDEQTRYMLFFGFIRDYKGLDLLLKAYADSRFREMNVKLLVAGEFYNNSEQYFQLEEQLGLKGKVIWHNDFIPDSEVRNYFSAADIIVQPYKSATQSGVTQIAYHFEKPMLVTNVGGLAEIIPNGKVGYVVEPNEHEIADALVAFFNDNLQDAFAEGIKVEKEKYSWKKMTEAIQNLLKQ
ncbi:MAG: glycosyltransferase [Paludibacter sp.]|nr:glycosyltransferase [Paludibacter sp.]